MHDDCSFSGQSKTSCKKLILMMIASKDPAKSCNSSTQNPPASSSIPLLRKPRPPSDAYIPHKTLSSSSSNHTTTASSHRTVSSRPCNPVPPPTTAYTDALIRDIIENEPPPAFHIYPLHPKGPPLLPPGKILRSSDPVLPCPLPVFEQKETPNNQQSFTLNDFLRTAERSDSVVVPSTLSHAFISRESYAKMTSLFTTHAPTQERVNTVDLEGKEGDIHVEYCCVHNTSMSHGCVRKPFTTIWYSLSL